VLAWASTHFSPATLAASWVQYNSGEKRFQEQFYNSFIPCRNYKNFIIAHLLAELLKTNLSWTLKKTIFEWYNILFALLSFAFALKLNFSYSSLSSIGLSYGRITNKPAVQFILNTRSSSTTAKVCFLNMALVSVISTNWNK